MGRRESTLEPSEPELTGPTLFGPLADGPSPKVITPLMPSSGLTSQTCQDTHSTTPSTSLEFGELPRTTTGTLHPTPFQTLSALTPRWEVRPVRRNELTKLVVLTVLSKLNQEKLPPTSRRSQQQAVQKNKK